MSRYLSDKSASIIPKEFIEKKIKIIPINENVLNSEVITSKLNKKITNNINTQL